MNNRVIIEYILTHIIQKKMKEYIRDRDKTMRVEENYSKTIQSKGFIGLRTQLQSV